MKKILLTISLVFIAFISVGQENLVFTEVIAVDGTSQDELYNRAKMFVVDVFVSANDVMQLDDKENGQIVCKGSMIYNSSIYSASAMTNGHIDFTFKIFLKEGRYKYDFCDFQHKTLRSDGYNFGYITTSDVPSVKYSTKGWRNKVWLDLKSTIDTKINYGMRLDMKKAMEVPVNGSDDW